MRFRVGVVMLSLLWSIGFAQAADPAPVVVLDVKGAIGVGTGHTIEEGFARARAELIVLRLDTPGGLVAPSHENIRGSSPRRSRSSSTSA